MNKNKLKFTVENVILSFIIFGMILLVISAFRFNTTTMQDSMRIYEIEKHMGGGPLNLKLERYFTITYLLLYLGFIFVVLGLFCVFQRLKRFNIYKSKVFNISSVLLLLSLIATFITFIETKKPVNEVVIGGSQMGLFELPLNLKYTVLINRVAIVFMIGSLFLIVKKIIFIKKDNKNIKEIIK